MVLYSARMSGLRPFARTVIDIGPAHADVVAGARQLVGFRRVSTPESTTVPCREMALKYI